MPSIRILRDSIRSKCGTYDPLIATISYTSCGKSKSKNIDFSDFPEYAGVTSIIINGIDLIKSLDFNQPVTLRVTYKCCKTVFFPCQEKIDKHFCSFGEDVTEIYIQEHSEECGPGRRRGEAVKLIEKGVCGQIVPSGVIDIHTKPTVFPCKEEEEEEEDNTDYNYKYPFEKQDCRGCAKFHHKAKKCKSY